MKNNAIKLSYEFFPPRSERMQRRLWRSVGQLERLHPAFISVTFGALGSDRHTSIDTAISLQQESALPVAAHLTAAGNDQQALKGIVEGLHQAGINRLVALRGDLDETNRTFAFDNTAEFVAAISSWGEFDISVGAYPETHPQATSSLADLQCLKAKLDAGASRALTQYFFDADVYLRFRDQAAQLGIDKPLVPGILPIHNLDRLKQFSQQCGANLPTWVEKRFTDLQPGSERFYQTALETAVNLCEALIKEGVDHFHFYTLNQSDICFDISRALGVEYQARDFSQAA